MPAQPDTHSGPAADGSGGSGSAGTAGSGRPGDAARSAPGGEPLLAALLDGMDAALCAFDADGVVTHWNREAERILGWTGAEAVGRTGLAGWAARSADAEDVQSRLMSAMTSPGREVHEFALVTKGGGRVLVRTQSSGVRDAAGRPAGVYCAFQEVHTQIDLERSVALSEALFDDASWGMVLVDADLRPAVGNAQAARSMGVGRAAMLGRPLGELLGHGCEELESALQHVLASGSPPAPADLWVTLRGPEDGAAHAPSGGPDEEGAAEDGAGIGGEEELRRCWRSGFLRLASPLAEEPVPMGVAWLFQDVTAAKLAEQEASRVRFRDTQLHRAARAAAECEDPWEAAAAHLEFALAGFADHALLDLAAGPALVRALQAPSGAPGPCPPGAESGLPMRYAPAHPALQAYERAGSVRTSVGGAAVPGWAAARCWPADTLHGLCSVLRSRGRTFGVVTFLRSGARRPFDRSDARYAEDVAVRLAAAVDLAGHHPDGRTGPRR